MRKKWAVVAVTRHEVIPMSFKSRFKWVAKWELRAYEEIRLRRPGFHFHYEVMELHE